MLKPNSQVTNNLIRARELIADEKNWCVDKLDDDRGRHCAIGAFWAANETWMGMDYLRDATRQLFGITTVASINNSVGHAAVMKIYDRAIELSLQDAS